MKYSQANLQAMRFISYRAFMCTSIFRIKNGTKRGFAWLGLSDDRNWQYSSLKKYLACNIEKENTFCQLKIVRDSKVMLETVCVRGHVTESDLKIHTQPSAILMAALFSCSQWRICATSPNFLSRQEIVLLSATMRCHRRPTLSQLSITCDFRRSSHASGFRDQATLLLKTSRWIEYFTDVFRYFETWLQNSK